jgi:hypothetical protein
MNNNCRSIVHFTSLCVPFLETSTKNRSIVILTSKNEDKPIEGELLYAVSTVNLKISNNNLKSMINMFIECLALELSACKIRINGVASSANNSTFRVNKDTGVSEFENRIFLESVAQIKPLQLPAEEYDQVKIYR